MGKEDQVIYTGGDTNRSLTDLKMVVHGTSVAVRRRKKRYDTIVVRGLSGALVGAPVALAVDLPLAVVRKPKDSSHNGGNHYHYFDEKIGYVVGEPGERCLFLDDFSGCGDTELAVLKALPLESRIVECYFYERSLARDLGVGFTEPMWGEVHRS